jgi:hypothetical protein
MAMASLSKGIPVLALLAVSAAAPCGQARTAAEQWWADIAAIASDANIEHDWRANRYHAPSDDLEQPGVLKEEAMKLDDFVAALTARVANADSRPQWLPTSVFRPAAIPASEAAPPAVRADGTR